MVLDPNIRDTRSVGRFVTRLFLVSATALTFSFAHAQLTKPVLLTGPAAQGTTLQLAKEVVQLAAQHGYNGVALGVGMDRMTNPSNIDLSGVKVITDLALQLGLKYVCWRLDTDIPNNQAWADAYNGGTVWPVQTRPPSTTWKKIAAIWQAVRDTSAQEITAAGGNPNSTLLFVIGNEPGIGGTGGPSLGPWTTSGFYYNLFLATGDPTWFLIAFPSELEGQAEGYIEPGYWTMMRNIRGLVKFSATTYAVSFEGAESSLPGQMASCTGADAQALYSNCFGYALNAFAPNTRKNFDSITGTVTRAAQTPVQSAAALTARLNGLLTTTRSNPLLANEHVILTEFNISTGRLPDFADPFPYREELLKQMANDPDFDGVMIYTAYNTEQTTNSVQLFNRTVTNGVVTITPIGSNAVGPAYFNMVP